MRRALAAVTLCVAAGFASPTLASADPPPPPTYRQAVEDAYNLVRAAAPSDLTSARRAVGALEAGTGTSQLEILSDLERRPPEYDDARVRLLALLAALDDPATTVDPELAHQRLHDVLALPRYDALHRPPSPVDRFVQWVRDRIDQLLRLLFGGSGAPAPAWIFYLIGAGGLAAVAFVVFRSTRGRFTEGLVAHTAGRTPRSSGLFRGSRSPLRERRPGRRHPEPVRRRGGHARGRANVGGKPAHRPRDLPARGRPCAFERSLAAL